MPFWLDWLPHWPLGSSICALSAGMRGVLHGAWLFMWLLGIQTQVLLLSWKAVGKPGRPSLQPFQFAFGCGKPSKSHQEQNSSSFPDPANYHRSDHRHTAILTSKFLLLTILQNYLQKYRCVSASIPRIDRYLYCYYFSAKMCGSMILLACFSVSWGVVI